MHRKTILRLVSAAIAIATLISVLSLTARASAEHLYDYSRPGSQHTVTLNSADILERILSTPLPEAERNYLVAYGDTEIKYDDGITTSYVIASYSNGTLTVAAREYSYLTASGAEIVWIPIRADLLGETRELTRGAGDTYDTSFAGVPDTDESLAVRVVYALDIKVTSQLAAELANKAYNDAPALQAQMDAATAAYQSALSDYIVAKEAFDNYQLDLAKHKEDAAAREAYLIAKRDHDAALKKFNDYLAALAIYKAACDDRQDYLDEMEQYKTDYAAFSNYLNEYKKYENLHSIYQAEVDTLNLCRSQLKIIELTKVKMSDLNRDLYSSIVSSSLVDLVLSERDTFESPFLNVPEKVIDLADDSTERLRVLLGDYFALTTETAKYNYYAANYNAFHSAFNDLFDALFYLAKMSFMWMVNGNYDDKVASDSQRFLKYQILVAQLYLVCMAISDGPVETIDPSYLNKYEKKKVLTPSNILIGYIGDEKTLNQLIGDYTQYITDTNNAKPITTGFPSVGEEPQPPPVVKEPTMPDYVPEPTPPTAVGDPGDPPTVVDDPGDPPTEVLEPTEPTPPVFDERILALCAAYGDTVKERSISFDGDVTIREESSVTKRFINVETVNVTFYNVDGTAYHTTVDRGTYADYRGPLPVKEEDSRATYAFAGWQTAEGVRVDITSITEDIKLYPYFEPTLKFYTVTWDINGETKQEKLPYGAIPSYTGIPQRPSTGEHKYIFSGWTPEIIPVEGDATYVAVFREQEIISSVPGVTVVYDGVNFTFDATGSLVNSFELTGLYELRSPFSEATLYTAFATVTLTPQLLDILEAAGVSRLTIDTVAEGNAKHSYTVLALGEDGERVELGDAELDISFSLTADSYDRIRVRYASPDGRYSLVPYTVHSGAITFSGRLNTEYSVSSEYVAHSVSSDFANITTHNSSYFVGDTVKVSVELGVGKRLVKLYYRTSDGREEIIYNRTFVMPAGDITILAVAEEIMCKVTFVNGDSIMSTVYVPYGEIPTPPEEAPRKPSDGSYEYTFIGWSPEIDAAYGDTTYSAVYESRAIEKHEAPNRITIYQMLTIAVAVVFALMLGAVVWIGIMVIRRFKA